MHVGKTLLYLAHLDMKICGLIREIATVHVLVTFYIATGPRDDIE